MSINKKGMSFMHVLIVLLGIFLAPSFVLAAYQNPTVVSNQRQANGTVLLTFAFAGNAGEPTVTRGYVVTQGTTPTVVRNWIDDTIKELDLVRTAETLPSIQPGQTVTRLAKSPSVPTAQQVWLQKLATYLRVKDSGIAATNADLATLKADLETTYQAGFILGQN